MINVRLNPEVWKRAKACASERGTTLERWVTEALEAHVARQARGRAAGAGAEAPSAANGADSELAWRVAALEQAVDHLAAQMSAVVPGGVAAVIGGGSVPAGGTAGTQTG